MNVKGISIKNCKSWVENEKGEDKWIEVVNSLPEESREHIKDGMVFTSNWYPLQVYIDVNDEICKRWGDGTHRIIFEMAREGAQENLKTTYRIFMKIASPGYIVKKAARLFTQFYDEGELKLVKNEENHFVFHLENFENFPIIFERIAGYMEGVLLVTRAKNPKATFKYDPSKRKAVFDVRFL